MLSSKDLPRPHFLLCPLFLVVKIIKPFFSMNELVACKFHFSVTLKTWDWLWKKYHISLFIQRPWGDWLFILALFLSTFFARAGWLENECECKMGKLLFGMNLSLLYWFIWNKHFERFIKSNSNNLKRKQFNFLNS